MGNGVQLSFSNFVMPTDNSNLVPKLPNLGSPFLAQIFHRSKIDVKNFQKQLKNHGLKINWNRDIYGQSLTISGGKKSKFVNFLFLILFFYIKSCFISFKLAKEIRKTKTAHSFIENKDFFSPLI